MSVLEIRRLQYTDASLQNIHMEVLVDGHPGWLPYHYVPSDTAPWTIAVTAILADSSQTVAPFVPPTAEELRAQLAPLSKRQLRRTLVSHGISIQTVAALLGSIPDQLERELALIDWEDATEYERSHPLILRCASAFNLTPEQVDAMWAEGLTI